MLSRFIKPIAIGIGAAVVISLLGAAIAAGATINIRFIFFAGVVTSFVSYWILEFSRRLFFNVDVLAEASTKGETVVDAEYDSKVQAALQRKRQQEHDDA